MLVHFWNCWQGGLGLSLSIKNYQFNHSYHYHILAGGGRGDLWCPCQLPITNDESSMINIAMKTSSSWQVVAGGTEGQLAATRWHWSAWIIILGERCDNDNWYWSIIINTMINSDRNSWWKERCVWYQFRSHRSRSSRCQLTTTLQWAPAHHPWCRWVVLSSPLSTSS